MDSVPKMGPCSLGRNVYECFGLRFSFRTEHPKPARGGKVNEGSMVILSKTKLATFTLCDSSSVASCFRQE